ncbi:MAG: alginate export family protein [Pseudomonadales bacterium]|nr:alginate export family protein [Pseudomonadales bacterium]
MKLEILAVTVLLSFVLGVAQAPAQAAEGSAAGSTDDVGNLLTGGKLDLSFRYRYEFVDQESFDEDADASTLRTRLTLQSGEYRDFDFLIEFDDVREVIWDDFNAGAGNTPSRTEYPVVADPKGTELNQGYVDYNGIDDAYLRLGRQRINFDNQRFVGGVGWRQQEQTFDAVLGNWSTEHFQASVVYVDAVRRIFGEKVSAGKDEQDGTYFINAGGDTPFGRLVGYYYHFDSEDRPGFSSGSVGARFTGSQGVNDDLKIRYALEFASQKDVSNNPADISAEYWLIDVGAVFGIYDIGLGWEVLSGDDSSILNEAFQTPLATGHAFNGWADVFLTTPAAGLDDRYLKFKATPGDFLIDARYHDFDAESGSASFGSEIDVQFGYKFNGRFRGDLFFADFSGKSGIDDVTKFWLMATLTL